MSSTTVTPKQVIGGLELYPAWTNQPKRQIRAMTPFIEKIPEILTDYLDKPVTVRSWAEAKRTFNRYLYHNGFAEALCDCDDKAKKESMFVMAVNQALQNNINLLDMLLDGLEELMETLDQTDREILIGPSIGLSGLALRLFDMHLLTIADLLKLQPTLILKTE